MNERKVIRVVRLTARALAVVTATVWTLFALASAAGEGVGDLIENLPNALPWLVFLAVVLIAVRWELAGAALLLVLGGASVTFFHAWTAPVVLFGVSLPITLAGAGLLFCHFLDRPDA